MTQTPYQPGISYLPKYGDRYMNTNDFAPAQGSPSSAKAGAVTTTAQLIPGQDGTVPYTGAPPAAADAASTVTMADPFANNTQFQSIMDRTNNPSFGVQPTIGFRQNINYDPGANNNIPPFTPTDPNTGTGTTGGAYFVSDNSDDDNTGPGVPFYNEPYLPDTVYDIDTSFGVDDTSFNEGQDELGVSTDDSGVNDFAGTGYTDDMTVYDDDLGTATTPTINDDTSFNEGQNTTYTNTSSDDNYTAPTSNNDTGSSWSNDSGWSEDSNSGFGNDFGGEFSTSTTDTNDYDFSGSWWSQGGKIPAIQTSNGGK